MTNPITITSQASLEQGQRVALPIPCKDESGNDGCPRCGGTLGMWPEKCYTCREAAVKEHEKNAANLEQGQRVARKLPDELKNAHVAFGLKAQGKLELVHQMRQDGKDWGEIAHAICWMPEAVERHYYMHYPRPASDTLSPEIPPHIQYLRQLPAAKAGQSIEEAAADRIRELEAEVARLWRIAVCPREKIDEMQTEIEALGNSTPEACRAIDAWNYRLNKHKFDEKLAECRKQVRTAQDAAVLAIQERSEMEKAVASLTAERDAAIKLAAKLRERLAVVEGRETGGAFYVTTSEFSSLCKAIGIAEPAAPSLVFERAPKVIATVRAEAEAAKGENARLKRSLATWQIEGAAAHNELATPSTERPAT